MQGKNKDKIVVSEHSALVPKVDKLGADALAKPGEDEVEATVAATRAALDALVAGKVAAVQPKTLPKQPGEATYIRYTPANQDPSHNSGAKERIIKMQACARVVPGPEGAEAPRPGNGRVEADGTGVPGSLHASPDHPSTPAPRPLRTCR